MHNEAYEWVRQHAALVPSGGVVLDIGGRDINGSTRTLFDTRDWTVLDILPGPNVNIVADAATWTPDREYDAIVCTEVFEHAPSWPSICATAFKACKPGGVIIATMAGPGRPEHSAVDGGWSLHPGEYYGNVDPDELRFVLETCGWEDITVDQRTNPADVRVVAHKPGQP